MKQISSSVESLSTLQMISIIGTMCVMLIVRGIIAVIKAVRSIHQWLTTKHDFFTHEGDQKVEPITATGWQLVGMCVATVVVCTLLSIEW